MFKSFQPYYQSYNINDFIEIIEKLEIFEKYTQQ